MIIDTPLILELTGPRAHSANDGSELGVKRLTHKLGCFYNASGADLGEREVENGEMTRLREWKVRVDLSWRERVWRLALDRQSWKERQSLQRRKLKMAGGTRPCKIIVRGTPARQDKVARSVKVITRSKINFPNVFEKRRDGFSNRSN